jgi:protease-4
MSLRSTLLVACLGTLLLTPSPAAQVAHAKDADKSAANGASGSVSKLVELTISADGAEDPIPENPLGPTRRNFRRRIEQIRAIAADPTVTAVQLEIEGIPGLARSLDLIEELKALKAAGKTIVCYTETLDRNGLLFASLADHLCMPPSGMIILEGMVAESMYYKDLLARFDAKVEVLHIGDFKTAYENFARDGMSLGQRTTLQNILGEYWEQTLDAIGEHRGLERKTLDGLFQQLIVPPDRAKQAKLLDQVGYRDAFDAKLDLMLGEGYERDDSYGDRTKEDIEKMLESPFALFAILPAILDPPKAEAPDEDYVAIVYATGPIMSGESTVDWQGNVASMGSETIVEAIDAAGDDEHCKAIVLRVNSPGGSALASDMIWRAIERAKRSKPVVSSMGSVAASGGYWISMGCTAIVAQPSTLTGSIGVVGMLPDLSDTLANNGIKMETVAVGPLGDELALLAHGPTEVLKSTITRNMENVYQDFLRKVVTGRKMEPKKVAQLAKGRVWTGRQAAENGLIDELGGLSESIELACALAGVDASETPLFELPEAPNPLEQFEESLGVMMQTRSPLEDVLTGLGFGDAVMLARRVLSDPRAVHGDTVQAVMPFSYVIR